jgi:hypothetical protein
VLLETAAIGILQEREVLEMVNDTIKNKTKKNNEKIISNKAMAKDWLGHDFDKRTNV